jgi:hypothetical protein
MRVPDLADARAGIWAWRALRVARGRLANGEVRDVALPAPPAVPERAVRAVQVVLRRQEPSCLERALVLQSWLASHGVARDVVVGTKGGTRRQFKAHAWVDGEPQPDDQFTEILRLAP